MAWLPLVVVGETFESRAAVSLSRARMCH
jgi:hypothetical protein